jgi:hypothetical protein
MKFLHLVLLLTFGTNIYAQLNTEYKANMPKRSTNSAVAYYNGKVYVFGTLDSTKLYSGIHQSSFVYDTITNTWDVLPNLPDTLGKIAMAASVIKDTIYIIGGYHVYANGNEKSSTRVHRFVPAINQFIADGSNIPIAIDDQVQDVWRDSLIYVITGWSNTTNVPNVQIYNPTNNTWSTGTSTPNINNYKAFGASGIIVQDTIYYFGGASLGTNFPITNYLRKGIINPNNPQNITWQIDTIPNFYGYRMGACKVEDKLCFVGGSSKSYNYNGIAYNGSGVAPINNKTLWYHLKTREYFIDSTLKVNKDYRNMVQAGNSYYLIGGIDSNNEVSNACIKLVPSFINSINKSLKNSEAIIAYPNPAKQSITLQNVNTSKVHFSLFNINGIQYTNGIIEANQVINIPLPVGTYLLCQNNNCKLLEILP